MTPEGAVKKSVRALLAEFNIQEARGAGKKGEYEGWYFMPGGNGRGVSGIPDFMGHYKGLFFSIETKAPGEEPEGFQALQIKSIRESGGMVFVVDGPYELALVRSWLNRVKLRWLRSLTKEVMTDG